MSVNYDALCIGCAREAADIPALVELATDEGLTPEAYAADDGTFNPINGHFLCDACYIRWGQPSTAAGWVAP